MRVRKAFEFDAAHYLPNCPEGHPCKGVHGHHYAITVTCEGDPDPALGFVVDYHEIGRAMAPVVKALDHSLLNDIPGLQTPSTEVLCVWIWTKVRHLLPLLAEVDVAETPGNGCAVSFRDMVRGLGVWKLWEEQGFEPYATARPCASCTHYGETDPTDAPPSTSYCGAHGEETEPGLTCEDWEAPAVWAARDDEDQPRALCIACGGPLSPTSSPGRYGCRRATCASVGIPVDRTGGLTRGKL